MPVVPAEGAGQLEDLDEPPEPRVRGGSGRASLMKPLVVLALPGMYLFYKYSQYRREQRELSRRRVTERELQHLHHKIVSISLYFSFFFPFFLLFLEICIGILALIAAPFIFG